MNQTRDEIQEMRSVQTKRIERITAKILSTTPHIITFVFSEDEISFRIDGTDGSILAEAYRGTHTSDIESMSDEKIEGRLKELLALRRLPHP